MHRNIGFFKVGATTDMDVFACRFDRKVNSTMPLMIRRLGARDLARPARRLGDLTAMFVLIARPLVFGIALLLAGQAQAQAPGDRPA